MSSLPSRRSLTRRCRSGKSIVHKQPPLDPSAFQQSLDAGTKPDALTTSSVRYWSDFSRVFYHPKSLVQLYDFELNSTIMPFERFSMGTELFDTLDKEHDIVDRDLRPFAEECDRMQGLQVFTTIDDAWGGFASSYLEALRDEYPKTCIWTWGLQNPVLSIPRDKRQLRLVNTAQTLSQVCAQATMVVPLALPEGSLPPSVSLDAASPWHVSALLATAAETGTLQSRLNSDAEHSIGALGDMTESLNTGGNQTLANMKMAVGPRKTKPDGEQAPLDIDLSRIGRPQATGRDRRAPRIFGQLSSVRGYDHKDDDGDATSSRRHQRPRVGEPVFRRFVPLASSRAFQSGRLS